VNAEIAKAKGPETIDQPNPNTDERLSPNPQIVHQGAIKFALPSGAPTLIGSGQIFKEER